jgi:hypothetical protein
VTHRCHLEQRTADQRAVCACGWAGRWYKTGARAVEQGTTHIITVTPITRGTP